VPPEQSPFVVHLASAMPHTPLPQVMPLQQFRSSAQALPRRTHRQRPLPSLFFLPTLVLQMPVQHWPFFVQAFSLRVPSPQGPSGFGRRLCAGAASVAGAPTEPPKSAANAATNPARRLIPAPKARVSPPNRS
jgi:hypothetical protein